MPEVLQYPTIPEPTIDPKSLQVSVSRLKEAVEMMTGQRGPNKYSMREGMLEISKQVGNSRARIMELNELVVNANSALAQRTTMLEAEMTEAREGEATLTARITQVDTARVDGDVVLAQSVDTLRADVLDPGGAIPTLSAQVSTVDQARINGDNALASRVTTVETTSGNNTATINTHTTSINGMSVKYGMVGTINGSTGGFIFTGIRRMDGTTSFDLEITANVLIQGNLLVNGTITSTKIGDGEVEHAKIELGGVTNLEYEVQAGSISSIAKSIWARAGSKVHIVATMDNADTGSGIELLVEGVSVRTAYSNTVIYTDGGGNPQTLVPPVSIVYQHYVAANISLTATLRVFPLVSATRTLTLSLLECGR